MLTLAKSCSIRRAYASSQLSEPPDEPSRNSRKKRNLLLGAGFAAFLTLGSFSAVTYKGVRDVLHQEQQIEVIQKQNNERRSISREIRAASKDLQNAKLDMQTERDNPERFVFTFEGVAQRLFGIRSSPVPIERAERERAEQLNAQFASLYAEAKKKYLRATSDKERYDALEGMLSVLDAWAEALENLFGRTTPNKLELMAVRTREILRRFPQPPAMNGRA